MAKKTNRNKRRNRSKKNSAANAPPEFSSFSQPLTDRNLQTLLEQNSPGRYGSVALDMDRYAREQQHLRGLYPAEENMSMYSGQLDRLLEFGQLNPLLDHLSDLTLLDDVCFPDYYENLETESAHAWPDLLVLEEYVTEELGELGTPQVNFQYPVARPAQQAFRSPDVLPTNEDAPLLHLVQVDELLLLKLGTLLFRVRPKQIQPWEKTEPVAVDSRLGPDALCRFTYFREDLDGTLHAPTLLGLIGQPEVQPAKALLKSARSLVRGDTRELVMLDLKQLFSPLDYALAAQADSARDGTPEHEPAPNGAASVGSQHLNPLQRMQQKVGLPLATLALGTAPPTAANSVSVSSHTPPFWLDILDPLEEEMKVLSKTFGLHPLTTEDIFLGEAREKVELFRLYYFVCFTSFDIVYERRKQRLAEHEKKLNKLLDYSRSDDGSDGLRWLTKLVGRRDDSLARRSRKSLALSVLKNMRVRSGELCPLNMYMIVFQHAVLTFHFSPTPHPINVRRRARMLKDHLHVSADWICYALIDDITDSFAPMIDAIEQEVYLIEDEIMRMHSGENESDDDLDLDLDVELIPQQRPRNDVFYRRQRSKSVVDTPAPLLLSFLRKRGLRVDYTSLASGKSSRSSSTSTLSKIVAWKRKGDMLRRIGECRKRVMSVMRLLGLKADVIRGFSKRFSETDPLAKSNTELRQLNARLALRQEILMYLGDIQDHIVTMVQSLNHYEKLLARSHLNYLAQINIDMTKVNNDTNDVLGKITILGTIVLPINVVTGLWGMNCIVPGQDHPGLTWFYGILVGITAFSFFSYIYARKVTGL